MGGVPVEQDLTEEQVLHFLHTRQHNQRKFRRDTSELRKVAKRVRACA